MVGMGMIFDETYRPFFEQAHAAGVYDPRFGVVPRRTGRRRQPHRQPGRGLSPGGRRARSRQFVSFREPDSIGQLLTHGVDFVCVATPDDRHFAAAKAALEAGKHVLIEKPSVLSLAELDELDRLARQKSVLAKVVYHKLLDPDHKKLRTLFLLLVLADAFCQLQELFFLFTIPLCTMPLFFLCLNTPSYRNYYSRPSVVVYAVTVVRRVGTGFLFCCAR